MCTTAINITAFYILHQWTHTGLIISNIIAWILAFIFSFISNKLFVFQSREWTGRGALKQMLAFFWTRSATMLLDTFLMWLWVSVYSWKELYAKVLVAFIVIVVNYLVSKLFVFHGKEETMK